MSKKPALSQEDIDLFRNTVKRGFLIETPTQISIPKHKSAAISPSRYTSDFLPDDLNKEIKTADDLFFFRGGLQHKIIRKLRQGKIPIGAKLDLHGMNVKLSYPALVNFITTCQKNNVRLTLVIHGKGYRSQFKPVLKNYINEWLREDVRVLAFCSAQPKDGGSGAAYVMLKST